MASVGDGEGGGPLGPLPCRLGGGLKREVGGRLVALPRPPHVYPVAVGTVAVGAGSGGKRRCQQRSGSATGDDRWCGSTGDGDGRGGCAGNDGGDSRLGYEPVNQMSIWIASTSCANRHKATKWHFRIRENMYTPKCLKTGWISRPARRGASVGGFTSRRANGGESVATGSLQPPVAPSPTLHGADGSGSTYRGAGGDKSACHRANGVGCSRLPPVANCSLAHFSESAKPGPQVSERRFAKRPSEVGGINPLDPRVDQIQEMKSPASSHREQPWLSSVYGSLAAIGCTPSRETETARSRERRRWWLLANGGKTPASMVRVVGGEDGDAHHMLDRLLLGQKGYG
uniref:Uncharacterized protein n=1 Tax=Oryza punctata TaxID=4537 RepID=A0A0E0LHK1_ORYPU